jgi:hypothetical protein
MNTEPFFLKKRRSVPKQKMIQKKIRNLRAPPSGTCISVLRKNLPKSKQMSVIVALLEYKTAKSRAGTN